ncbi:peptide chain release factor N(5)-glutamine methyltransferase [Weissella koreensis]|uniref:Release factor glutamine methyltransferase n=1 Tax=Weissella koreensis TaxID=165096 RepID=A0A7H1MLG1_9LACO|nr:peptide chain release factor N(5)-glutamine methyltransferase [Weissella koreensis]AVH75093.1 peptide chain release factor N(5)-glutamine methyltransferase [Weissella koreensis]EJF33503.1 N5-glutamine S-adenosyl-L-methionine-dependent methyltransferase [Weissella koreensis KCTC 3621]MCZ9310953.1 peptide chain release factor N(5)-glutamine methyltransferase [Weissella koreensis]QGN20319.1 peptide chain release factor N(5)-glutamine methyltransferase [Weissella koreensis]QNT64297.1 peptide ch
MFELEMTFEALREWGDWQLEPYIQDKTERMAQIDYLLTGMMNWNYGQLQNNLNTVIEDEKRIRFMVAVRAIKGGQPVQYALGHAPFYGREFKVDRRVLIPRPETEELVDWILKDETANFLNILDIGTGSGAIAITLKAERPNWTVTASDISKDALSVAKDNQVQQNVDVSLVESDLLDQFVPEHQFDVIVSNPPYIAEQEKFVMDDSVLMYEPDLALFAADEGLALYKRMAQSLLDYLTPKGSAYFEIGYLQGPALVALFKTLPDVVVELRPDLSGHDRMIKVKRTN